MTSANASAPAPAPSSVQAAPGGGPQEGSPDRRGALRPIALISPRARLEAGALERGYRLVEAAAILCLAVALLAADRPERLLSTPLASAAPFVLGAPWLIWRLASSRAYGISRREPLRGALARASGARRLGGAGLALMAWLLPLSPADQRNLQVWFGLSAATVFLLHLFWWRQVRGLQRAGKLTPNIVIVGATPNAERLIAQAAESGDAAVIGVFDDRAGRIPAKISGVPVLGDTEALLNHRVMPYVDRVVITVPARAQERVRQLIERLRVLPNEVSLFLDIDGEVEPSAALSRWADAPLAQVSGQRHDEARIFAKRMQDLVLGSICLALAAPVMLLVALAVKLDSPGPLLFRQRRYGFNNEEIVVWKFRSMRHEQADATAARQVSGNDERITRVGRVIRRTSLDELPQLFNVLAGDMSLVGPRPHAVGMMTAGQESARLVAEYAHRHRVKPGLTGWAAIHGSRGPVNTPAAVRRRVALDVEYIERQSLWLDLYILVMTAPCILGDRTTVR